MSEAPSTTRIVDRYEPLLGTVVEVRVELLGTGCDEEADELSETIAQEMLRLQSVLSSVDRTSEFARWCRGEIDEPSDDLRTVLALATRWQDRSEGRFNPAAGLLTERWRRAETEGVEPGDEELRTLVAAIERPRWSVVDGAIDRDVDATDCTLNALAKGWIADRGADLGSDTEGLWMVAVNAGGDVAVRGPGTLRVGIENPATPHDTAPPLTVVELRDAGLATSGDARRWFDVAGTRHSHVLDPRTGRPVDAAASITVVARTAADADALATILGVLPGSDAIAEAARLGLACLVVEHDGRTRTTDAWMELETDVS